MDAKNLLRRYLEQRREMGERELVLDGMTVEDVLRIVGAADERPQQDMSRRRASFCGLPLYSGTGGMSFQGRSRTCHSARLASS